MSLPSYWEPTVNSDRKIFRSLVATPLHQRGSDRDKKTYKGSNLESTTKNLLPEFEMEATLGEKKEEESQKPENSSAALVTNPKGKGKGTMRAMMNPSQSSLYSKPYADMAAETDWPAKISLCGWEVKGKEASLFSVSSSIGVGLNPMRDLLVNLKRPMTWSAGSDNAFHALSCTPPVKYGPKRNGPGPGSRQSKRALGLEPLSPYTATNSDMSCRFSEQEEEGSPSHWLYVRSISTDADSEKEYDPSEHSETEDTAGSSQPMPKRQKLEGSD